MRNWSAGQVRKRIRKKKVRGKTHREPPKPEQKFYVKLNLEIEEIQNFKFNNKKKSRGKIAEKTIFWKSHRSGDDPNWP
jgi:hypothetical protein